MFTHKSEQLSRWYIIQINYRGDETNNGKARIYYHTYIRVFAFPTISDITIIVNANPSIIVRAGNNITG